MLSRLPRFVNYARTVRPMATNILDMRLGSLLSLTVAATRTDLVGQRVSIRPKPSTASLMNQLVDIQNRKFDEIVDCYNIPVLNDVIDLEKDDWKTILKTDMLAAVKSTDGLTVIIGLHGDKKFMSHPEFPSLSPQKLCVKHVCMVTSDGNFPCEFGNDESFSGLIGIILKKMGVTVDGCDGDDCGDVVRDAIGVQKQLKKSFKRPYKKLVKAYGLRVLPNVLVIAGGFSRLLPENGDWMGWLDSDELAAVKTSDGCYAFVAKIGGEGLIVYPSFPSFEQDMIDSQVVNVHYSDRAVQLDLDNDGKTMLEKIVLAIGSKIW